MDQRISQQQSQKLHLSPQLRQYLKFLYLPQMELRDALQQELAENPALEELTESPSSDGEASDNQAEEPKNEERARDENNDDPAFEVDFSRRDRKDMQSLHQFQEVSLSKPVTLTEHLDKQISFHSWSDEDVRLAKIIIGHFDAEGFLRTEIPDIAATAATSTERIEAVLKLVQTLDPAGIGARSLQECLLIQLQRKYPGNTLFERIVAEHLSDIARRDFKTLSRKLNISPKEAEEAIREITKLDPRPARNFHETRHLQVIPDAQISFKGSSQNEFEIEIFKECLPRVRINPEYRRMLRDSKVDASTRDYLKSKIGDGSQLLKALELRESTLRLISEEIVKTQADFFVHGFSHLKPLRLKDLAERLQMHPSAISRAIHDKHVMTPRGTLPFKSFFSQRVETGGDEDESQKSIMQRIQQLIENEDSQHPLSDQQIVEKLRGENISIARRTAAKYRELLKILPTHLRRKRS